MRTNLKKKKKKIKKEIKRIKEECSKEKGKKGNEISVEDVRRDSI